MVRGLSFTPNDDTVLAKAWVEVSAGHDEQNAPKFWSNVTDVYNRRCDLQTTKRTPDSLRSRWTTLQRSVQKYLAAEKAYRSKPVSGETSEDAAQNIMKLYCNRAKRTESHGVVRDGPPLRSVGAVEILRRCLNFVVLMNHLHARIMNDSN